MKSLTIKESHLVMKRAPLSRSYTRCRKESLVVERVPLLKSYTWCTKEVPGGEESHQQVPMALCLMLTGTHTWRCWVPVPGSHACLILSPIHRESARATYLILSPVHRESARATYLALSSISTCCQTSFPLLPCPRSCVMSNPHRPLLGGKGGGRVGGGATTD